MKRAVLFGVVLVASLFLVSFASAMLVGYLSNSVTATVTILPPEEPPIDVGMPMFLVDCVPPVEHNGFGWKKYVDENNETIFNNSGECVQYVVHEVCRSEDNPFKNPGLCVAAGAPGKKDSLEAAISECLVDFEEDEQGFFECLTEKLSPPGQGGNNPGRGGSASTQEVQVIDENSEELIEEENQVEEEMVEDEKEELVEEAGEVLEDENDVEDDLVEGEGVEEE